MHSNAPSRPRSRLTLLAAGLSAIVAASVTFILAADIQHLGHGKPSQPSDIPYDLIWDAVSKKFFIDLPLPGENGAKTGGHCWISTSLVTESEYDSMEGLDSEQTLPFDPVRANITPKQARKYCLHLSLQSNKFSYRSPTEREIIHFYSVFLDESHKGTIGSWLFVGIDEIASDPCGDDGSVPLIGVDRFWGYSSDKTLSIGRNLIALDERSPNVGFRLVREVD